MSSKPTNPKDALGIAKVPFSVIPAPVIGELGLALMEGALKYGRHNYREAGVRASVYYDAAFRHLSAWWEGQDIDPDSGLSHVAKAMASLTVLRDSMMRGNWADDRPPPVEGDWVAGLNIGAKALLEKYPNPKEAVTAARLKKYCAPCSLEVTTPSTQREARCPYCSAQLDSASLVSSRP